MLHHIMRLLPFILAGILLASLLIAMADGGQANWLTVAVVALLLAVTVLQRTRAAHPDRRP